MGVLADFFVATDAVARDYDGSHPEADVVESKGLTSVHLSTLWAILEEREWTAESMDAFEAMNDGGEEGPWIERLPSAFVGRLASLTPGETERAAAEWATTEEMECDPEDVIPLLTELQELAGKASAPGKSMFLYVSL
jgi:hypothetical protein